MPAGGGVTGAFPGQEAIDLKVCMNILKKVSETNGLRALLVVLLAKWQKYGKFLFYKGSLKGNLWCFFSGLSHQYEILQVQSWPKNFKHIFSLFWRPDL